MDTDDHLRHLLDHPPRDPEPPRDPVFTAQVMARLRPRPAPAAADGRGWWGVAAAAVVAALVLPFGDDAVVLAAVDALLLGEVALAASLLAAAMIALGWSRQ